MSAVGHDDDNFSLHTFSARQVRITHFQASKKMSFLCSEVEKRSAVRRDWQRVCSAIWWKAAVKNPVESAAGSKVQILAWLCPGFRSRIILY